MKIVPALSGPRIEIDSVRSALEAMRQGEPLGLAHPLAQFLSIQQYPVRGAAGSDTAIFLGLSRIIRQRLFQHRKNQNVEPCTAETDQIRADFRVDSDELQSWSVLYYRYVRVDLDLSFERLEALTQVPKRTLTRRQSKGIARLTHELSRRENKIRLRQRQAALRAQLPLPYAPPLIGRDSLLNLILTRLTGPERPRHVLLYGAPGVGKSSVALAAAHRLIDQDAVENIVWIESPDRIVDQITEQVGIPPGYALAMYLQLVDTLIVLDGVSAIDDLKPLGTARLILCATHPPRLDMASIQVPELDEAAALEFMAREITRRVPARGEDIDYFDRLYHDIGGNPGALQAALLGGRRYDPAEIAVERFDWDRLSETARLIWLILALSDSCSERGLYTMIPDKPPGEVQAALLDLHYDSVITWEKRKGIALTPLARAYATTTLRNGSRRSLLHEAIRRRADHLLTYHDTASCLIFLETLQEADVSTELLLDLAYAFSPLMERVGAWESWAGYLGQLYDAVRGQDRLWIGLHLGITYRWLARWNESAYLLAEVIQEAGQLGEFEMQADAMTELAGVQRYQGQRESAWQVLRRAGDFYRRQKLLAGLERVTAEWVQLTIDAGDLTAARRYLDEIEQQLPGKSPRLLNLEALLALHLGDLDSALREGALAQAGFMEDLPRLARTITLLGMIHSRLGNWSAAIDHLLSAMVIMEQTGDLLGHARARMNLAAVYIGQGNLRTALRYLRDLPAELVRLEDVESLEAASKNLEMLIKVSRHWRST